ncbi:MAG: sulfotransferase family 2 domain-containing protein [Microcoleaceae cyanobacterium]
MGFIDMQNYKGKLAFIRIPKTGGQTMMDILYQIFGFKNVLKIWGQQSDREIGRFSVQDFLELDSATIDTYPCMGGHITLDKVLTKIGHENFKEKYSSYTITRDPVDTVISLYNYYRTNTDHTRHEAISKIGFGEFIQNEYSKNLQCKYLGSTTAYDAIYNASLFLNRIVTIGSFDHLVEEVSSLFLNSDQGKIHRKVKNVSQKFVSRMSLSADLIDKIKQDNYQDSLLFEAVGSHEEITRSFD